MKVSDISVRLAVGALLGLGGLRLGEAFSLEGQWLIPLAAGGALVGLLVGPQLTIRPFNSLVWRMSQVPTATIIAGVVGLLIALLISALVTLPLSLIPGAYGRIIPLVLAFILSYGIITLLVRRSTEFFRLFGLSLEGKEGDQSLPPILVDTSVLIDGRIFDVARSGFLYGKLVVPSFVLQELQHIADSTDPLRRRRGRRGLEMLSRLQKEAFLPVELVDLDLDEGEAVDDRLLKLAKEWQGAVLTTDFNLRRVAEVQGVKALSLNDLATALKPIVMPGEEMPLRIIQEGKETGQGVGFMEDGTMVVVEGGRRFLNSQIEVVITRVLQTAMGRMIFAQPKEGSGNSRGRE